MSVHPLVAPPATDPGTMKVLKGIKIELLVTDEQATAATRIESVASIGSLQADATREIARAYTSTARELVS